MFAAVTGASGHLGANLVRHLTEIGWQVRALVRRDTRALHDVDLETVRGDLTAPESLAPLVRDVDVVFHCAALISIVGGRGGRVDDTNVQGVRHIAAAARDAGVRRFVNVSSCHAFDLSQPHVDETTPRAGPRHPAYDRSKWAGEQALHEFANDLDFVIVNPAALLGPHDYVPSRMGRFFLAVGQRRMPAVVPGGFYFLDVRDVSAAMVAAVERGVPHSNYLLGGHYETVATVVDHAATAFGVRRPPVVPTWLARLVAPAGTVWGRFQSTDPLLTTESLRALAMTPRSFDQARAREGLGFTPRPLEDTVRDAVEGLRKLHLPHG